MKCTYEVVCSDSRPIITKNPTDLIQKAMLRSLSRHVMLYARDRTNNMFVSFKQSRRIHRFANLRRKLKRFSKYSFYLINYLTIWITQLSPIIFIETFHTRDSEIHTYILHTFNIFLIYIIIYLWKCFIWKKNTNVWSEWCSNNNAIK